MIWLLLLGESDACQSLTKLELGCSRCCARMELGLEPAERAA
jgi:hypothetical protein